MAVGITEKLQGITTITLVVVVATGILTSVIGPTLLKWLKIDDPVAAGLALGGTGHAVGTGTAFRYGSVAGAMAGLAIGVTGLLYVFISPIVCWFNIKLKVKYLLAFYLFNNKNPLAKLYLLGVIDY